MIHPDTRLETVSEDIGYGVFATNFIPRGTIVYIKDAMEICIPPGDPRLDDDSYRGLIDRYSYIEPGGDYVISWDIAKYMNHSCSSNTLSTGYGFEIAVYDIHPGEQITDDYGMLNIENSMPCACGSQNCRKSISGSDPEFMIPVWDERVSESLRDFSMVDQPLAALLDKKTKSLLMNYFKKPNQYRSVSTLFKMSPAQAMKKREILGV